MIIFLHKDNVQHLQRSLVTNAEHYNLYLSIFSMPYDVIENVVF